MIPVFDGHNDILFRILQAPEKREAIWLTGEGKGHLDLPRMAQGGFVGGFFAIYMPSPHDPDADMDKMMDHPPYEVPLPAPLALGPSQAVAAELAPLKLDAAKFRTSVTPLPEERWGAAGMDAIEFLISKLKQTKTNGEFFESMNT